MNSPHTDRDRPMHEEPIRPAVDPLAPDLASPDLTSQDVARRGREELERSPKLGMLPIALGVAALVGLTLLVFTTEPPANQGTNQGTQPRTETPAPTPPK